MARAPLQAPGCAAAARDFVARRRATLSRQAPRAVPAPTASSHESASHQTMGATSLSPRHDGPHVPRVPPVSSQVAVAVSGTTPASVSSERAPRPDAQVVREADDDRERHDRRHRARGSPWAHRRSHGGDRCPPFGGSPGNCTSVGRRCLGAQPLRRCELSTTSKSAPVILPSACRSSSSKCLLLAPEMYQGLPLSARIIP